MPETGNDGSAAAGSHQFGRRVAARYWKVGTTKEVLPSQYTAVGQRMGTVTRCGYEWRRRRSVICNWQGRCSFMAWTACTMGVPQTVSWWTWVCRLKSLAVGCIRRCINRCRFSRKNSRKNSSNRILWGHTSCKSSERFRCVSMTLLMGMRMRI